MQIPIELAAMFREATLVDDNARRPAVSATESAPKFPALCPCGPPKTGSTSRRRRRRLTAKPSRWESSPSSVQPCRLVSTCIPSVREFLNVPTKPLRTPVRCCDEADQRPSPPRRLLSSMTPSITELLDEAIEISNDTCFEKCTSRRCTTCESQERLT